MTKDNSVKPKRNASKSLFNIRIKHECILLKCIDEINDGEYLNKFLYYPVESITGLDYNDVN